MRKYPQEAKTALPDFAPTISLSVAKQTPNIPFTKIGEVDTATLQKQADMLYQYNIISKHLETAPLLLSPAFFSR
jgi:hypothetical protein